MKKTSEGSLLDRIEALVEEEQRLRSAPVEERVGDDADRRLALIARRIGTRASQPWPRIGGRLTRRHAG